MTNILAANVRTRPEIDALTSLASEGFGGGAVASGPAVYHSTVTRQWPDPVPGPLLIFPSGATAETFSQFRERTAATPPLEATELVEQLRRSDLRGRGGAGFPAWRKIETVAQRSASGDVYVVANGEEGEPASCKDRYLLRHRPHLVLEGLLIAARAIGARHTYVYLSDAISLTRVRAAIRERDIAEDVSVFRAPAGYVSGEESAVMRALNGGPAKPLQKPPRPFEAGVSGRPTLVLNVETFARIAELLRPGAPDPEHVGMSHLLTLLGPSGESVLTEVPAAATLRGVAETTLGLNVAAADPVLAGGFFNGFLPAEALDVPLTHEGFRLLGTGIGCGSFAFLGGHCPVDVAADVMAYFDRENSHQCGSCFRGTAAMRKILEDLGDGTASDEDLAKVAKWSVSLRGRGACGTLDGATNVVATLFARFEPVIAGHATNGCSACAPARQQRDVDTRFRVAVP